jgi:23S rRNA (guanosine2251-2'-O)-methyltransferase
LKEERLALLAGHSRHQGIAARVSAYPFATLDALDFTPRGEDSQPLFLLLLDSVVDPHNFGALVRTALCVGMDAVLIPKDRAVAPTPAVSRASAGALEHMAVIRVTNMVQTMEILKARGLWLAGMSAKGGTPLFSAELEGPLALLVGGEEKGLRPLVQRHCDLLLSIPQNGPLDSLNASVAGAVVMYEAFRQRQKAISTRQ